MLCTGATFVKKNFCLVTRVVSFDTAGLHLLAFRILEPFVSVMLFHINEVILDPPIKSYFNLCFQVSQLLKYDGNHI